MKILIIEDSQRLLRSLGEGLKREGLAVDLASNGTDGLAFAETYNYDAIVLDLMLPGIPGLEVLTRLRDQGSDVNILILSAKDRVDDRVRGLRLGADDYLVKPFAFEELCARLRALQRRQGQEKSPTIEIGPLAVDTESKTVRHGDERIQLTRSEYRLLEFLAFRRGRTFSQYDLIDRLYSSDAEVSSNVIEVLVSGLRKKIHVNGEEPVLKTRRGFGYLIE